MTDPALVSKSTPIDVFTTSVCMRCIQIECTRSRMSESSMRIRSLNWKNDLFDNIPKASDELVVQIRSKSFLPGRESKFVQIPAEPIEVSTKKVELVEKEPEPVDIIVEPEPNIVVDTKVKPETDVAPKAVEVKEPKIEQRPPQSNSNTSFQQGTILNNPTKEVTLEPGSTYTFESED